MRHPLLKSHERVRKRVITTLRDGLFVRKAGNLVFICGGNEGHHLRPRFREYLSVKAPEFNAFQPEFAMKDYFADQNGAQLDLGKFEELIGELSHAIVIFPEAPGSFAETGYFSKTKLLAEKTILVLNLDYQSNDSFIMMGPARRFDEDSKYYPNVQIDWGDPNFGDILNRIRRIDVSKKRKAIDISELSSYDMFCLIFKIFDILLVATYEDVVAVFNSLMSGHAPKRQIRDLSSILVGAGFLQQIGEFGHYACLPMGKGLVEMRSGYAQDELELKLVVSDILRNDSDEFAALLRERSDVD